MTKDWEFDSVHKFAWRVEFGRMMGEEVRGCVIVV